MTANIALAFQFLYRIKDIFEHYFEHIDSESINDNFVVIYELLDEILDNGYPQITEAKILKEYITQEGASDDRPNKPQKVPSAVTNAVSWRPHGIYYAVNCTYLDVVEELNVLLSSDGTVLNSDIIGRLELQCQLSGMPEAKIGFNDRILIERRYKGHQLGGTGDNSHDSSASAYNNGYNVGVELEDVKFHQCVKLANFESERTISFIPPDGNFELMSYRVSLKHKPLFIVTYNKTYVSHSKVSFVVGCASTFSGRYNAEELLLYVPLPSDAFVVEKKPSHGRAEYLPESSSLVWKMSNFHGEKHGELQVTYTLPSVVNTVEDNSKQPIRLEFRILRMAASGLKVRYMKVAEKAGYKSFPYIRYYTKNGVYLIRTN